MEVPAGERTMDEAMGGISHETPRAEAYPTGDRSLLSQIRNRLFLRYGNLMRLQLSALFLLLLAASLAFTMTDIRDSVLIGENSFTSNEPLHEHDLYMVGDFGYIFFGILLGAGFININHCYRYSW